MKVSERNVYRRGAGFILRHPLGVVVVGVAGAVLSLLVTAMHLTFQTDRVDLISTGNRYRQLDEAYDREFQVLPEGVIIVIRSENRETAKAFATALAQRWEGDPTIDKVVYRLNIDALKHKALLYLSPDELIALRETLQAHHGFLQELAASPSLQNLFALINREITTALVGHVFTDFLEDDMQQDAHPDLGLLLALLQQMNHGLEGQRPTRSAWAHLFTKDAATAPQDGFLWSDDGQLLFVLVQPKRAAGEFSRFDQAVQQVRADVSALQKSYPNVEVGVTGKAVLDADEMGMAQRDTALATMLSVIGVTLLYVGLFKRVVRPLLALMTLLIALCWALGLTTFTIGHLNILTIVFLPMLMGLGIDYGSYVIARYNEERGTGEGPWEALLQTVVATGPGIAATALTTALTFGALLLTGFKGIAELGFIGGSGILLAALATFTVLPALLALQERRGQSGSVTPGTRHAGARGAYVEPLYRYPWATLLASALLAGVSLLAVGKVSADFNLLHLQAEGAESVAWVHKIFQSTKRSVLYAELMAGSLEEATRKAEAVKHLPSVAEVESIASVIPADQDRKRPLIEALRPLPADISLQGGRATAVDVEALRAILERIRFKMMEDGTATQIAAEGNARRQMAEVRRLITQFLDATGQMPEADVRHALSAFQEDLDRDLAEQLALLEANLRAKPVTLADLPPELRTRYIGKNGTYRLFVYPSEDVWEFQPLARFVSDIRSVDPDVLGTPVTNFEFTREILEAYEQAGLYAFLGIAFLIFLTFRAMRPALLALIPLTLGSLWTLGFMGFFQVKFNVANLIVLPLIMAPAVESGIMIISRYQEERSRSRIPLPLPKSTGQAVVFSALSTVVGFGSLMISHHQGIFSIGLLLTCGVGSVLLASLTVLPSLLALLSATGRARSGVEAECGEPLELAQPVSIDLRRDQIPRRRGVGKKTPFSNKTCTMVSDR
jgi:uncharacterized protein